MSPQWSLAAQAEECETDSCSDVCNVKTWNKDDSCILDFPYNRKRFTGRLFKKSPFKGESGHFKEERVYQLHSAFSFHLATQKNYLLLSFFLRMFTVDLLKIRIYLHTFQIITEELVFQMKMKHCWDRPHTLEKFQISGNLWP